MRDNRRLVWLDEALKVITPEGATQLPDVQLVMLMTARKKLKNLPTVDAMEVVHGEWTVIEDDYTDDTIYQCSVCKEEFVTIEGTPADNLWKYCPNCGAKMDLVTEDDDYDYLRDRCYECQGYGDDYYTDENGDLVSACDDCSYNGRDSDDD